MRRVPLLITCLAASVLISSHAAAQSNESQSPAETRRENDYLASLGRGASSIVGSVGDMVDPVVEVLGTELPATLAKYRIDVSLDPKFRDVLDENHIRLPLEFRYGLTSSTELTAEIEPFAPNPFQKGSGWGASYYRLGAKTRLPELVEGLDTALGIRFQYPLTFPPDYPSDGHMRTEPYITFEKELPWMENLNAFINVGYQFVEKKGGYRREGGYLEPDDNIYDQDNVRFTGGLIQYRGIWNPFIRAEYRREVEGPPHWDTWFIEPGVMFDLPRRYTHRLPGKWKAELGVRVKVEDADPEVEVNFRVRWRVRLHEIGLRDRPRDE